jgi:hypothetical protein
VASLYCKHDDRFNMSCPADGLNIEANYAPRIEDLCGGDSTSFDVCLECGQVQGTFPKPKARDDE